MRIRKHLNQLLKRHLANPQTMIPILTLHLRIPDRGAILVFFYRSTVHKGRHPGASRFAGGGGRFEERDKSQGDKEQEAHDDAVELYDER